MNRWQQNRRTGAHLCVTMEGGATFMSAASMTDFEEGMKCTESVMLAVLRSPTDACVILDAR